MAPQTTRLSNCGHRLALPPVQICAWRSFSLVMAVICILARDISVYTGGERMERSIKWCGACPTGIGRREVTVSRIGLNLAARDEGNGIPKLVIPHFRLSDP